MVEKFGIGAKHITKEGYEVEIVEKIDYTKRRVRFENGYEVEVDCSHISMGGIANPYHPSVFGVGYFGVGEYKCSVKEKHAPEYVVWQGMLKRCYDEKYQEKQPTYKGVTVCKEWLNFQNFAEWYKYSYPKINGVNFQLDKDLLQENIDNKIYSPDNCIFLPHNVNSFLTNKHSNNTSSYTGVSWDKANKKWRSRINLFGEKKKKSLGSFNTPEEASIVYQQAREIESEKVKEYLRSLNYLPEHVINLVN